MTAQTVLKALKVTGPITDVTTTRNQAGRVAQLKLTTPLQTLAVPATKLRTTIGLRSTWFTVGLLSLRPPQPVAPVTYGSTVTLASVVRGFSGVMLEQRPAGADWQPVSSVTAGATQLTATPTITTDFRLSTSTVAAGAVRIRVMPAVTITSATSTAAAGAVQPVLPDAAVDLQQENPDLTWTSIATGTVAADGTFTVTAAPPAGATVRVVVTPASTSGYAAGASAAQIVSG
jgi:hypothetical protein